jgi:hypothetical protein
MGRIEPHQVVKLTEKFVPTVLQYEDYNKGIYNFERLPDLRGHVSDYNGEVINNYGTRGAAGVSLPEGLEIIHSGSIIPTGDYYGTAVALKDIAVYNDNN